MTTTTTISRQPLSIPSYAESEKVSRGRSRLTTWKVVFVDYDGMEFDEAYLEAPNAEKAEAMAMHLADGNVCHMHIYPCE